jgi:NAD-dependent DNA ligase
VAFAAGQRRAPRTAIERFGGARADLPYAVDGMVVKVDSFADQRELGVTAKAPRWAVAFKYPAEKKPTVLRSIAWQVGKGRVFYFRPGHETFPVFLDENCLRVVLNAARWAAPGSGKRK